MNALAYASAYRQLEPTEKAVVDAYVSRTEQAAAQAHERISNALYRPIPDDVVEASRGYLDRPMVRAAIVERINELAAASELTSQRVVKELMSMAFSNIDNYLDDRGGVELTRCTPEQMSAVESVEFETTLRSQKMKIKLHSKLRAMEMLMKYMGMLETDNPHWRAEVARPIDTAAMPGTMTTEAAAQAYARLING